MATIRPSGDRAGRMEKESLNARLIVPFEANPIKMEDKKLTIKSPVRWFLCSSKLPGPRVRRSALCHLSAAEAVAHWLWDFGARNDAGFRDSAWQKSASLHSRESRACHWAGRDTAIRPLCHSGTMGWHWSDPRWTGGELSFIITVQPPPPLLPLPPPPPPQPQPSSQKVNKQRRWLPGARTFPTAPERRETPYITFSFLTYCPLENKQMNLNVELKC